MSRLCPHRRCNDRAAMRLSALIFLGLCVLGPSPGLCTESQNDSGASMASASTRPAADPAYPTTQLVGSRIALDIYLPDAEHGYYRGARFDRPGLIARVRCGGHTFFGPWKPRHNPQGHDDVLGPAEEFGMTRPLGFVDAKPGESFIKIGVGHLLRGDAQDYAFYKDYHVVTAAPWTVHNTGNSVEFRQQLSDPRGWGDSL